MIYTMNTTLQWEENKKKDFKKFYYERRSADKASIYTRIIVAYHHLGLI